MRNPHHRGPVEPHDGASAALDTEAQQQIEQTTGAKRWVRKQVERSCLQS